MTGKIRPIRGDVYSIMAIISMAAISGAILTLTSNITSIISLTFWLLIGLLGTLKGSARTLVISLPILLVAAVTSGQAASIDSPKWPLEWIGLNITLTVSLLIFIHSIALRDQAETVSRSVLARGVKVSSTLERLERRPSPNVEAPSRSLLKRVRLAVVSSLKTFGGLLGFVMPEEEVVLVERERLKNYLLELRRVDPNLMDHLGLLTKSRNLKRPLNPIPITLHYITTTLVLTFLLLTPTWIYTIPTPPQILESIDILQPEVIILTSFLYCALTLALIEVHNLIQGLIKAKSTSTDNRPPTQHHDTPPNRRRT